MPVVGVTFECDFPPEARSRRIVSTTALSPGLTPAQIDAEAPSSDAAPAWLEKYAGYIERIGMTPASFAARFSVPVRIRLTRVDGR